MATLVEAARSGSVPEEVRRVAEAEGVDANKLRDRVARGTVVILRNVVLTDKLRLVGVGEGLTTKVNVNLGNSAVVNKPEMELEKVRIAKKYGADSVMDLSTGGDLDAMRRMVVREALPLPTGTVPAYQAYIDAARRGRLPTSDDFIKTVEKHLKDGVAFMTIHAAITRELALKALKSDRAEPIVSRGGALIAAWMLETGEENPFRQHMDYLLELFKEYDAVISWGDSLRPGALEDSHDELHMTELLENARLIRRAREAGVMSMLEGPGHVPYNLIVADVRIAKRVTGGAPYYVLGPLPTDIAAGYDHIAAAIGAALAASEGADLLCYLTPAEHLSLPTPEQVREGLIAFKIAAHIADTVKLGEKALRRDYEAGRARALLDWEKFISLQIDPERAREIREQFGARIPSCTMCGPYCAFLILARFTDKLAKAAKEKASRIAALAAEEPP